MNAKLLAYAVSAAGLTGCATDYVPPAPVNKPGPEYSDRQAYQPHRGPGIFGDLSWSFSMPGQGADKASSANVSEEENFKKWRELMTPSERQEFEEWRAWQEWKRKNPK